MTAGDGRWHPGIGDPDATGWITVAAYLTACTLCTLCALSAARSRRLAAARSGLGLAKIDGVSSAGTGIHIGRGVRAETGPDTAPRGRRPSPPAFWAALAVTMLLLGINKQLDLQTWFTEVGRDVALAQGWYDRRFKVQVEFIAALAATGALAMTWLQYRLRRFDNTARAAAAGLLLLAVFIVIRAASFHHVDRLLGLALGGLRINAVMELSGIACVAAAAGLRWRRMVRAAPASVR